MVAGGFALFLLPKISSFLSMTGSAMIISAVLREKKNRQNPLKRILLAMSIIDVSVSSQWLFVNFFMPPWGTMDWTFGNYHTCVFQGAICQFNSASGFYNTMLAICYLLMIVFEWNEKKIKRIEPVLHFFPLAWGFCTTVTGLVLDLFHPAGIDCWIAVCPEDAIETYPGAPDCSKLRTWNLAEITVFRLAMFHGPVMFYCVLITAIMVVIYFKVKSIELKSARYGATNAGAERKLKRTKNVLWQGILYAGGFFMTWVLIVVVRLLQFAGVAIPQQLGAMAAFFIAFQGLLNALTFFRPMYTNFRKFNPELWGIHVAWIIVLDQFTFCCRETIPLDGRSRTCYSRESRESRESHEQKNRSRTEQGESASISGPTDLVRRAMASLADERLCKKNGTNVSCDEGPNQNSSSWDDEPPSREQDERTLQGKTDFFSAEVQPSSADQRSSSPRHQVVISPQEELLLNELKKTIPIQLR